jgi:hypothetical protein
MDAADFNNGNTEVQKRDGVVLLSVFANATPDRRNDSVVLSRTGEFSMRPILKVSEIGRAQPPPLHYYWVMRTPPNIIILSE